jgi:hypothetical protein
MGQLDHARLAFFGELNLFRVEAFDCRRTQSSKRRIGGELDGRLCETSAYGPGRRHFVLQGIDGQDADDVELGVTTFGGCVPSDLRRFLPLAVLRTWVATMVLLPTRFFFASAIFDPLG